MQNSCPYNSWLCPNNSRLCPTRSFGPDKARHLLLAEDPLTVVLRTILEWPSNRPLEYFVLLSHAEALNLLENYTFDVGAGVQYALKEGRE